MKLQRKVTLLIATGAVALGAGHVVQDRATERLMADQAPVIVSSVTPVAAGPAPVEIPAPAPQVELPPVPVVVLETAPPPLAAPLGGDPPSAPLLAAVEAAAETKSPAVAAPSLVAAAPLPECMVQLQLLPQPGAMIGLSLLAPCHANERIVLRHAGLAVTGKTSASGAYFGSLPALTARADVEVLFASGDREQASLAMPDAASIHRFIVQWQDEDAFQLHAFERGAGYHGPGHYSAAATGSPETGGFITLLGDSTTELPLLAEAFSYTPGTEAQIVLEAAITATTCGREILGETLIAEGGSVNIADLTLAMPSCDAAGDILVLKNLVEDMKLAAAE